MRSTNPRRETKQPQQPSKLSGWIHPQLVDQEDTPTQQQQRQHKWQKLHQLDNEELATRPPMDKWAETVDLQGFQPDEVKAKVNGVFHTLEITAQRASNPWQTTQQSSSKLKRVLPLPENVNLDKLNVQMRPADGVLVVKAPFVKREDGITKEQQKHKCHKPMDSTSANIPVMWKDTSSALPRSTQTQQGPTSEPLNPRDLNNCSVQEYRRLLKKSNSRLPGKILATEVLKEESSGKWKLLIDLNAVGFRREEVKVTFQETERVLVVEAKHDKTAASSQEPCLCVKSLRQEIVVPQWLDGKQMRFRLMENGVLRIQLPCLRNPCPKDTTEEQKL